MNSQQRYYLLFALFVVAFIGRTYGNPPPLPDPSSTRLAVIGKMHDDLPSLPKSMGNAFVSGDITNTDWNLLPNPPPPPGSPQPPPPKVQFEYDEIDAYEMVEFDFIDTCDNPLQSGGGFDGVILRIAAIDGPIEETRTMILAIRNSGISNVIVYFDLVEDVDEELLELVELDVRDLLSSHGLDGDNALFLIDDTSMGALLDVIDEVFGDVLHSPTYRA